MNENSVWQGFAKALGAENRDYPVIRGASGLDHKLLSLSVDEPGKRLILISAESDPRIAAMMNIDIQSAMPDMKILVARPITLDLGVAANKLVGLLGATEFPVKQLRSEFEEFGRLPKEQSNALMSKYFSNSLAGLDLIIKNAAVPILPQILSVISQAAYIDWKSLFDSLNTEDDNKIFSLAPLINLDIMGMDREHGICPIPLYEFGGDDWELFSSGTDITAIRERLEELNILQYFFPAPDQVALGLVDRGLKTVAAVEGAAELAPQLGHPFGHAELIGRDVKFKDVIGDLESRGFLVEGEIGMEVTPEGSTARASVKFRPREGIVTKLLNRFNVNLSASVSPKDFIR
ncbi:MAG: hypothetical protein ACLPIC_16880 [Rhodoblastus sp.]|uniref:hypothetical protein n=1 Tax=Rhodoblastus sp. TaxID=1962975 RepID=UPI003F98EE58